MENDRAELVESEEGISEKYQEIMTEAKVQHCLDDWFPDPEMLFGNPLEDPELEGCNAQGLASSILKYGKDTYGKGIVDFLHNLSFRPSFIEGLKVIFYGELCGG